MDMTLERQAASALAFTVEHGGGTFEAKTMLLQEWKSGFVVAIGGLTIAAKDATAEALAWLGNRVGGEYMTTYIGTWLQDEVLYIDAVVFVADRDRAIALGQEHGQQAIYDCTAQEVITL
jgi:hypothetical protein